MDRKHLLVKATELLPPMSAAEQRSSSMRKRGKSLVRELPVMAGVWAGAQSARASTDAT